jgi:hypothetical protein
VCWTSALHVVLLYITQRSLSLPASKSAAGKLSSSSGDALIEPFGITVTVNLDNPADTVAAATTSSTATAAPDLSLVVAVHPRIKGLMSPRKIEQLFAVLDYVTGADADVRYVYTEYTCYSFYMLQCCDCIRWFCAIGMQQLFGNRRCSSCFSTLTWLLLTVHGLLAYLLYKQY